MQLSSVYEWGVSVTWKFYGQWHGDLWSTARPLGGFLFFFFFFLRVVVCAEQTIRSAGSPGGREFLGAMTLSFCRLFPVAKGVGYASFHYQNPSINRPMQSDP
jgi:hypothetical protein